MNSDTNVDLDMKVTITARNITPARARDLIAQVTMPLDPDVESRRKVEVTAAWISEDEPTPADQIKALFGKKTELPDATDEREKTSAQAMDEAAPYVAPYIAHPITIDQIGEYLGSRASDEALVVVIADTYADASLVVDAIEVHSRKVTNTGEITSSTHVNGARCVRYAHGARVRAVARGSSRFSADLVIVVPGVAAQDAYTNAALMTNGKPIGSVRRLITEIPGVAGAQQDGAAS